MAVEERFAEIESANAAETIGSSGSAAKEAGWSVSAADDGEARSGGVGAEARGQCTGSGAPSGGAGREVLEAAKAEAAGLDIDEVAERLREPL